MHPLTVYDMAIRDHKRATAQRQREHLLTHHLRELARPVATPAPAPHRDSRARPAGA